MSDLISAEEARELLEGSTPGPWCAGRFPSGRLCIAQTADPSEDVAVAIDAIFADAALMAAAPDLARTVVALHAERDAARHALATLRAAVLDMRVQDNSRVAGEPWRVQIFESEWDALRKLAGGGQ